MQIKITHTIPDQTIEFLLDSAGRGASYWAHSRLGFEEDVKRLMAGGSIEIEDVESDPREVHALTLDMVQRGLEIMATKCPQDFADILTDDYDNNTGDAFLQFCIFGELVYQ